MTVEATRNHFGVTHNGGIASLFFPPIILESEDLIGPSASPTATADGISLNPSLKLPLSSTRPIFGQLATMAVESTLARQATLPADTVAVDPQAKLGGSCTMTIGSPLTSQVTLPPDTGAVQPQAELGGVPLRERTESLESVERVRNEECERAMEERARLRWEETLKRRAETKSAQRRHYVSALLLKDGAAEDATIDEAGQQDGARHLTQAALALPAEARTMDEETALAIELPWQEWCERWCQGVEEERSNCVVRAPVLRSLLRYESLEMVEKGTTVAKDVTAEGAEESRAVPKPCASTAPRPILRRQGITKHTGQPCVAKRVRLEKPEYHRATLKMGSSNTETTNAVVAHPVQGASSHATLPVTMAIAGSSSVPEPVTMAQDNAYVEVAVESCTKNGKRRRDDDDDAEEGGDTKRQCLFPGGASRSYTFRGIEE
ncbi:hypothetical protein DFH06DRAFT_1406235 [Mycena polygramma]|nr:hypothetical protein DFH06DRAFT_1406235 [Mycena polygramma]